MTGSRRPLRLRGAAESRPQLWAAPSEVETPCALRGKPALSRKPDSVLARSRRCSNGAADADGLSGGPKRFERGRGFLLALLRPPVAAVLVDDGAAADTLSQAVSEARSDIRIVRTPEEEGLRACVVQLRLPVRAPGL